MGLTPGAMVILGGTACALAVGRGMAGWIRAGAYALRQDAGAAVEKVPIWIVSKAASRTRHLGGR
eukprot:1359127-Alexandrium_andersonii.AAC.1